jgi:hypothetical protein
MALTIFDGVFQIFVIGVLANLFSIGIFMRKRFSKMNSKYMFIGILITDCIALTLGATKFAGAKLFPSISTSFCRAMLALGMIIPSYSAWILVLISSERYISIIHGTKSIARLFKNKWSQIISLLVSLISIIT